MGALVDPTYLGPPFRRHVMSDIGTGCRRWLFTMLCNACPPTDVEMIDTGVRIRGRNAAKKTYQRIAVLRSIYFQGLALTKAGTILDPGKRCFKLPLSLPFRKAVSLLGGCVAVSRRHAASRLII